MSVVVYLDVDGVVSALSLRHGFGDGRVQTVDGYHLNLSRSLGLRLAGLEAELRWLTTWGDRANEVGALMGLPPLPLAAPPPPGATASGPWKFDIVRAQVERERQAFVWIDDDAISHRAEVWADHCGVRNMLVRPQAAQGLTPADMDVVEDFIADWTGRSG